MATFLKVNSIGAGQKTTATRDAEAAPPVGTIIFNTSASSGKGQLEVYTSAGWVGLCTEDPNRPFNATGGTLSTNSRPGFNVHTFTGGGSLQCSGAGTVEYMVIGAGGGFGSGNGGGGSGAGALRFSNSYPVTAGAIPVSIGSAGGTASPGQATSFGPISSPGGGGGGYGDSGSAPGRPGGSGGGAGTFNSGTGGGGSANASPGGSAGQNSPASGWGNPGGNGVGNPSFRFGGGGGGAGQGGIQAVSGPGAAGRGTGVGDGGDGLQYSITGSSTYWAAGRGGSGGGPQGGGPVQGKGNGQGYPGSGSGSNGGVVIVAYPNS